MSFFSGQNEMNKLKGVDTMMLLSTNIHGDMSGLIINLGVIILMGMLFGRIAEYFKIPAITGYLIAGLLLGPISGFVSLEEIKGMSIISDVALGFIAFQVGNELWFGKLKNSGMKIVIITVVQAVFTTAVVTFLTMFFVDLSVALVLGAIAAATAPAPIMMIIKKYRAKGELTDTILPVVGLDDAVGVIMFGILLSISVSMLDVTSAEVLTVFEMIKTPLFEILISIGLGGAIGVGSGLAIRTISHNRDRKEKNLNIIVISVFLTTGTALFLGASPILTPMIAGTVVTNMINKDCYVLEEETIRFFVPPIMIAFFTIAGAQLQFDVVFAAGIVGVVYILGRIFGKMFGSYLGTTIVKSSSKVKKYLGVSLLPQSGVAIGLSIAAYNELSVVAGPEALVVKNVILASVLFFALTGPVLVKIAFTRADEIEDVKEEKVIPWKNSHAYQE